MLPVVVNKDFQNTPADIIWPIYWDYTVKCMTCNYRAERYVCMCVSVCVCGSHSINQSVLVFSVQRLATSGYTRDLETDTSGPDLPGGNVRPQNGKTL